MAAGAGARSAGARLRLDGDGGGAREARQRTEVGQLPELLRRPAGAGGAAAAHHGSVMGRETQLTSQAQGPAAGKTRTIQQINIWKGDKE